MSSRSPGLRLVIPHVRKVGGTDVDASYIDVTVIITATILGSGATAPTRDRGVAATVFSFGSERVLVDCGEGTGRQLLHSGIGSGGISTFLLTHGHADHYLGLPGLLKSWAARGRTAPLTIAGPPGAWQLLGSMHGFIGPLPYELTITEPEPGDVLRRGGFSLIPARSDHRIISYAWALVEDERPGRLDAARADADGVPSGPLRGRLSHGESVTLPDGRVVRGRDYLSAPRPGRRLVISGDTRPCADVAALAEGADLLIHEATFLASDEELARTAGHSTAAEAAQVARDGGVRHLCLNHLSSRYQPDAVAHEAEAVFTPTTVTEDFDMFTVPHRERGPITHKNLGGSA